jgi:ribonuclease HII
MASRCTQPTLRVERALARAGSSRIGGIDEVGRGALCGPVTVAVVVVNGDIAPAPPGVRDSKQLSPALRTRLVAPITSWALEWAIGEASPDEIRRMGLTGAMRTAAHRALAALAEPVDTVLLDGSHDYLTCAGLDEISCEARPARAAPKVITRVRADVSCSSVAAASIVAKVHRDQHMVELDARYPAYGWSVNKGYGTPQHLAALGQHGPTPEHRYL